MRGVVKRDRVFILKARWGLPWPKGIGTRWKTVEAMLQKCQNKVST
jgi:hypothetical protein